MLRMTMTIYRFRELNQVFRKKGKEGTIPFYYLKRFNFKAFIDGLSDCSMVYFFIYPRNIRRLPLIALFFEGYFFIHLIKVL